MIIEITETTIAALSPVDTEEPWADRLEIVEDAGGVEVEIVEDEKDVEVELAGPVGKLGDELLVFVDSAASFPSVETMAPRPSSTTPSLSVQHDAHCRSSSSHRRI